MLTINKRPTDCYLVKRDVKHVEFGWVDPEPNSNQIKFIYLDLDLTPVDPNLKGVCACAIKIDSMTQNCNFKVDNKLHLPYVLKSKNSC